MKRLWGAVGLLWCTSVGLGWADGLTLYVAPQGRDTWSGTLAVPNAAKTDGPLASMTGARDAVRRLRNAGACPAGGIAVEFQRGRYEQLAPCVLTAEDSGTAAAPVVYRAAKGAEVRITGSVALGSLKPLADTNALRRLPECARGKVLAVSLPAQGLFDYGVEPTGASASPASGLQLIYGDEAMTLARWPNEGFVKVAGLPGGKDGGVFAYAEEEPSRWAGEQDPRGQGYWAHDWAACAIAFERVDPAARTITQRAPGSNYGFRKGGLWFGYNLLCELDRPGEYYVDRVTGRLYFWPPEKPAGTRAEVTVGVRLVQLDGASHVQLRGLTFENCRGTAVQIAKGESIALVGCTLRNAGRKAVEIRGGSSNRVAGCELYGLGDGGIDSWAGDEKTLAHCGHVFDNNHIHDYARFSLTYGAAVQIGGCGHTVTHNLIHDGPHVAVLFGGRENLMAYNEVHSVCLSSGEMGAFYTGRNWTLVGNAIVGNFIHDIYNPRQQRNRAVMLDDGAAGITVASNLIVRVAEGVSLSAIGNAVDNNVFVQCFPAVSGWQTWDRPEDYHNERGYTHKQLVDLLLAVPVDTAPWRERYPWLAQVRDAVQGKVPMRDPATRTRVERNVVCGGSDAWMVHDKKYPRTPQNWLVGNSNWVGADPLFMGPAAGDYRLRPESPALKAGARPLPLDRMGLYASPERAVWPVRHAVNLVCTNLTYAGK